MSNDENTPIELMEVDSVLPPVSYASSDATDTPAPTVYADDIYEGAKFRDNHHFATVFGAYQERTHTKYVTYNSRRLKDDSGQSFIDKYKYERVAFKCQHSKPRDRGNDERSTQINRIDCKSKLHLNLNRTQNALEVMLWIPEHNHVCALPQFDVNYRPITPPIIPYTAKVLATIEAKAKRYRQTPYSRPTRAPPAAVNGSFPTVSALHTVNGVRSAFGQ